MTTRALVLGGGGVAGIAWETGILAGLAESGVDVLDADLLIGTSAGSMVAAQVASGGRLEQLLARQIEPAQQTTELTPTQDIPAMMTRFVEVLSAAGDPADLRRRMGELALSTETVPEEARREVMLARLPVHEWPQRAVRITAVDTATGDLVVFDRESGVSLVDAVGASCAVPGVWPPVTINGARYMDGGMRSTENADLAAGYDKVLVLQVLRMPEGSPWAGVLADQVAQLREAGSAVHVLTADDASTAAFSTNPLDPAVRTPSGLAGLAQGRTAVE
ncbi:MAG TPA: patatin-like phospholipase family protein, partial [Pseudonocardiaceae bacterium]|nr:patatin-like phospholipase family protein [Pseudonocardiaceae bacterium]